MLALPVFWLRLGFGDSGNFPESDTTRRAYDVLAEGFGPGFNGSFIVVAETPNGEDDVATVERLQQEISATEGVAEVTEPQSFASGAIHMFNVYPTSAPQDEETTELVHRIRNEVVPAVVEGGTPVVRLTGDAPGVVEYQHVSAAGERLDVDWTATPVPGEAGETRYLLCGLDVTARKHVEAEIRRSRARIVSASDAERKRLERNLHDGAQQHLVSVSHAVHLGVRFLRTDPDQAEKHLDRALVELNAAHEELRELARGLHPQILTVRGLAAAVRALAGRAPIPVTVITTDDGQRWPTAVESAAYYVVAEALTNVTKYSGATSATVRVLHRDDLLTIEVSDDGRGGA